jgi:hypothetical protein
MAKSAAQMLSCSLNLLKLELYEIITHTLSNVGSIISYSCNSIQKSRSLLYYQLHLLYETRKQKTKQLHFGMKD